jgi:uroporphyrinogen decarboxylase
LTIDYLAMQIDAGANAVQLFESAAHLVSRREYETFAHPCHCRIFEALNGRAPGILFVREQPFVDLMAATGADVLSVGRCVDLRAAKREYGGRVAFQGNVDNQLLVHGSPQEIDKAVRQCIRAGGHAAHILNLSHGVLSETPFDNVCRFVETCQSTVLSPNEGEP